MEPRCRLTRHPIDPAALLGSIRHPEDGAVLLFLGTVRNHNDGREVDHLDYEAYVAMAEQELARVAGEAAERWNIERFAVTHRIGRLEIGEVAVAIAVAAPHRAEAYDASRYIIEELKRRIPIWKREGYVGGKREWLGGELPAPS